jgi:hypothetical protein
MYISPLRSIKHFVKQSQHLMKFLLNFFKIINSVIIEKYVIYFIYLKIKMIKKFVI